MKKYKGFTLIELLITLAIVAILLTVGMPAMKTFMQGSQLVASTNELLSALHIARSEAVKSNARVTICSSSDGTSCSGSPNWRDGWIVFVAATSDLAGAAAECTAAGGDCLLRVHAGFTDKSLSVSGMDTGLVAISSFTFNARGLPSVGGVSRAGSFSICSFDATPVVIGSRAVVLSLAGRVRISDNAAAISCPTSPPV